MQESKEWIDMMGREVAIPKKYSLTIVSLVPSQTELLYDLGLGNQVIGQTKFCVHPDAMFKSAVKVGGTKKLNISKILQLNPDIIIGNKEENDQQQIEELQKHFPVWMSDIQTQKDNIKMITELGLIFGVIGAAAHLSQQIQMGFALLTAKVHTKTSCIYLIWNKPMMAAGQGTFINEMLNSAGFDNLVKDLRYPEISLEEIRKLNPELLLLSSEPFPFKEEHTAYFEKHLDKTRVLQVDGEYFSWYGSRMVKAPAYFYELSQSLELYA